MINLKNTFVAPEGFYNPTIREWVRKIKIINLTPNNNWEIKVKIIKTQYMPLVLIFNLI